MELQERESAWVVSLLIVAFSSQGMRKSQVLIANLGDFGLQTSSMCLSGRVSSPGTIYGSTTSINLASLYTYYTHCRRIYYTRYIVLQAMH